MAIFTPFFTILVGLERKNRVSWKSESKFQFQKEKKNISVFLSISTISPCPNISSIGRNPYLH